MLNFFKKLEIYTYSKRFKFTAESAASCHRFNSSNFAAIRAIARKSHQVLGRIEIE